MKESTQKGTPIDALHSLVDHDYKSQMVKAELIEAIMMLKDKRQQQLMLLTLKGYDSTEIGKLMGLSTNNVYVIRSRAIEKLKGLMQ